MPDHAPLQKPAPGAAPRVLPASRPFGAPRGMGAVPASTGGEPLPGAVQARMEASFGQPLDTVRVHHGPEPEAVAAQAYTRGEHIHFRPGVFQPGTSEGLSLLGHELTHVVQQRAGRVPAPGGGAAPINRDARLEREAEQGGARAARGLAVLLPGFPGAAPASASAAPVQRGALMDRYELTTREDVLTYIAENHRRYFFRASAVAQEWNAEHPDEPVPLPGGGQETEPVNEKRPFVEGVQDQTKKKRKLNTSQPTVDEDNDNVASLTVNETGFPELEDDDEPGGKGEDEEAVLTPAEKRALKKKTKREAKATNKAAREQAKKARVVMTDWPHIRLHTKEDITKEVHGVFAVKTKEGIKALIEEALEIIRRGDDSRFVEETGGYPKAYAVDMGRKIGTMDGYGDSQGKDATYLHVVMESARKVKNAFPGNTKTLKYA